MSAFTLTMINVIHSLCFLSFLLNISWLSYEISSLALFFRWQQHMNFLSIAFDWKHCQAELGVDVNIH